MSKWDESQYIFQRMDRAGHIEYKSWSLFFAFLKVSLPLTTSRRHRKWKLTRGEESDTDSGGESGGEVCSHLQFPRQDIFVMSLELRRKILPFVFIESNISGWRGWKRHGLEHDRAPS